MAALHTTAFYSFKGGVGRSLLLANTAVLLARKRRVLVWDLDLEAPGLHRVQGLRPEGLPGPGFLEWLGTWQAAGGSPELDETLRATLRGAIRKVPGYADLAILPAFQDDTDFAAAYLSIDWSRWFRTAPERGLGMLQGVLAVAAAAGYDHVLIDARTGITDLGGLVAAVVPDATVLVGNLSDQNTYGLLHVRRALETAVQNRIPERGELGPLELVLVASPVPADPVLRAERVDVWRTTFRTTPFAEIPFVPRLLFREELLAVTDETGAAAVAYRRVADHLDARRAAKLDRAPDDPAASPPAPTPQTNAFVRRVARLLERAGYGVELVLGAYDLLATRTGLFGGERLLVQVADATVGRDQVRALPLGAPDGTVALVVARAFTGAAREAATTGVRLVTLRELERQLFDPAPYLARLRTRFEASPLARTYVSQQIVRESGAVDFLPLAHAWAGGVGSRVQVLLGDYGTGKTAFFRRFAYELAIRATEDPDAPFPLAIDLKEFPNAITLEGLLQEHLRATIGWHGNPGLILDLLSAGHAVLLLDAFDEMGVAAAGRAIEEQLRMLLGPTAAEPAEPAGNRVLLSCRTHFFRDQRQTADVAALLGERAPAAEATGLARVVQEHAATIEELALLDRSRVDQLLVNHLGVERAAEARAFLDRSKELEDLASRPVLLELIIQSLPRLVQAGGPVTIAGLYDTYTRQWLEDRSGGTLLTRPEQRARVLERLAGELWGRADRRIHHRDLLGVLRTLPPELLRGLDLDRVDLELRTAAFLTRTAEGFYGFSHKSFLEFFFAKLVVAEEGVGDVLATEPLSPEVMRFVAELAADAPDPLVAGLRSLLTAPYRAQASENALRLVVALQRAWKRTIEVEGARLEGARLRGADLAGCHLPAARLTGADLAQATLHRVQLVDARLEGANLQTAGLDDARLEGARLEGADLRWATLRRAHLSGADLQGARAVGADFVGALLGSLRVVRIGPPLVEHTRPAACLRDADLRGARFAGAFLTAVAWEGALLTGATAPGCEGPPPPGMRSVPPRAVPILESGAPATTLDVHGRLMAIGALDGTVRIVDRERLALVGVLEIGALPRWVSWCSDGSRLGVAAGSQVTTWRAGILEATVATGANPHVAWAPTGLLAVGNNGVFFVGETGGMLCRRQGIGSWADVAPDGRRGLVVSASGVEIVSLPDLTPTHLLRREGTASACFLDDDAVVVVGAEIEEWRYETDAVHPLATRSRDEVPRRARSSGWGIVFSGGESTRRIDGSGRLDASMPMQQFGSPACEADGRVCQALISQSGFLFSTLGASFEGIQRGNFSLAVRHALASGGRLGRVALGGWLSKCTWTGGADAPQFLPYAGMALALTPADRLVIASPDAIALHEANGRLVAQRDASPPRRFIFDRRDRVLIKREAGNQWWDLVTDARTAGPAGDYLASSPRGDLLLGNTADRTWIADTDGSRTTDLANAGRIIGGEFPASGTCVLVHRTDATSQVFDTRTGGRMSEPFPTPDASALSPDGALLACAYGSRCLLIRISGAPVVELRLHCPCEQLTFLDADRLLTKDRDGVLRVWTVPEGAFVRALQLTIGGGWVIVEADGRHRGEGGGLQSLVYFDPDEVGYDRTVWYAEDLPALRDAAGEPAQPPPAGRRRRRRTAST